MAATLKAQLEEIHQRINDLSIDDAKAKELDELIGKSVQILQQIQNPSDDFFEHKRKTAITQLEKDLSKSMKGYWESKATIERISHFSSARNTASLALSRVLSSFKR